MGPGETVNSIEIKLMLLFVPTISPLLFLVSAKPNGGYENWLGWLYLKYLKCFMNTPYYKMNIKKSKILV